MSNRNHAWRLEDENGNKIGKESSFFAGNIKAYLNGQEIAEMQGITYQEIARERIYTLGDTTPMSFSGSIEFDAPIVTREITAENDLIIQECHREARLYQYRYGHLPAFLSMSERGYQSYYLKVREYYGYGDDATNDEFFAGIPIICHPTQEEDVKALGTAIQVGIQGRGFLNE